MATSKKVQIAHAKRVAARTGVEKYDARVTQEKRNKATKGRIATQDVLASQPKLKQGSLGAVFTDAAAKVKKRNNKSSTAVKNKGA